MGDLSRLSIKSITCDGDLSRAYIDGATSGLIIAGLKLAARRVKCCGRKAPANPWGGNTLEWQCPSPPPHDNFKKAMTVADPYEMGAWEYVSEEEGWVLKPNYVPVGQH